MPPEEEGTTPETTTPAPSEAKPAETTTPPAPAPAEPAKPAEPATPPAPVQKAPEKYELSLPEGTLLDDVSIKAIEAAARQNNLTNEQAQHLVNTQSKQYADQVLARQESWLEMTRKDPEIGGDNFQENLALARQGIDKFDTDGKLKAELDRLGYGNHPEMVRFMSRVGRALKDSEHPGSQNSGSFGGAKSLAEQLYGGTKN